MRIEKQKLKTVVLLSALAVMLCPMTVTAQYDGNRGLFGRGSEVDAAPNRSLLNPTGNGITLQNFGENQNGITLQNFGETAPLGSGWLVLMGAGFGYAALKQRKTTKSNRNK